MIRKGCEKLSYADISTIVLEEDGTIVEDEDYFELLEESTVFILLRKGEEWKPQWETTAASEYH